MNKIESVPPVYKLTYEALDLIPDLQEIFYPNASIEDIMLDISDEIYYHAAGSEVEKFLNDHYEIFNGNIFNHFTTNDFFNYCQKRFPDIEWQYKIIEKFYVMRVPK